MKALKYILFTGIACCIAVGAAVFIFMVVYLTPDVIRNSVRLEIQKQLRRNVVFGNVEVGIFKGICLQDVVIRKSHSWETEDIVTCRQIRMRFGYLPLLAKKLLIRSVELQSPGIRLQSRQGRGISFWGKDRFQSDNGTALDILALPGSVHIRDGDVRLTSLPDGVSLHLSRVEIAADSISLVSLFTFSLSACWEGRNEPDILFAGKASIPRQELTADLSLRKISCEKIGSYFGAAPLQKGVVSAEAHVQASGGEPVSLSGAITFQDGLFVFEPLPAPDSQIFLTGAGAALQFESEFDISRSLLTVKKINGSVLSSPCQGSGLVRFSGRVPSADISLNLPRFSLDGLSSSIVYGAGCLLRGLKLGGDMGLRIKIEGPLDSRLFPGIVMTFNNNTIAYPPLGRVQPAVSGSLGIDGKNISVGDMQVGTKNFSVTLAGDVSNYLRGAPRSNLRIVSSRILFAEMFNAPDRDAGEEVGPFDFGSLTFSGPIQLGNTYFLTVPLQGVQGGYFFEKNRLTIKDLGGGIGETGTFNLFSTVNFGVRGLDYYVNLRLADTPLKVITSLFQLGDLSQFVDGMLTGTCSLKGSGTKPSRLLEDLAGDASFELTNGYMKGFNLPEQLSSFVRTEELTDIRFNRAQLQLSLRGGAVDVSGIFSNPKIELHPSGEVGLDARLNLTADLKLSPGLFTADTKLAAYLPREGGWVVLPVIIKGTATNPRISLSEEALNYIISETLPRLLMEMMSRHEEDIPDGDNESDEEEDVR